LIRRISARISENRARADTHRRCQTALGLARFLETSLYHLDIQHPAISLNFRKESNSDFPKSIDFYFDISEIWIWIRQQDAVGRFPHKRSTDFGDRPPTLKSP
jgi:hypothetical protein